MHKLEKGIAVALFGLLCASPAWTQAEAPAPGKAPEQGETKAVEASSAKPGQDRDVASLQKEANSKFLALRASMTELLKQLASQDESKAERIKRGLRLIQEAKLNEKMRSVQKLLEEASWDQAISVMGEVQVRLNQLMLVLLDRDDDLSDILERIEALDAFKKRVDKLLDEQRAEREASAEAERLAEQLERIEKAKQRVDDLLKAQQGLRGDTQKKGAGQKESAELAEQQDKLRKEAENLEGELREIERDQKELGAGKPGESKPGEGQPGEGKPSEGKPGEGKPSEGKPSEGQPGESQPSEPQEGKPSSKVGEASKSMGQSQQKLQKGKPEDSLDDQEKAIEELKDAQEKLGKLEEEARRKLMEIPFEKMKQAQLATKEKTDRLAEDMEEAETGGEDGEGGSGEKTPGKNNVQQAVPKQKNAAGSLKEIKPGKAKQDQQDAVDQLEEAQKRLEDALAQLRQELQEEVLKALEERFTEMLARQRQITSATILTQKKRKEIESLMTKGQVPSWVRERCQKLADGERSLVDEAASALRLIEEEGSTAVFPEIVKDLADDLRLASRMLERFDTGPATVEVQKSVEQMLEDLLDALTRRLEQKEGGT